MSDYENILNILCRKAGLNRNQVKQMIKEKKEKVGAGYLTDQGSMFLIASDKGINLSEEITKPISIEYDNLEVHQIPKRI